MNFPRPKIGNAISFVVRLHSLSLSIWEVHSTTLVLTTTAMVMEGTVVLVALSLNDVNQSVTYNLTYM